MLPERHTMNDTDTTQTDTDDEQHTYRVHSHFGSHLDVEATSEEAAFEYGKTRLQRAERVERLDEGPEGLDCCGAHPRDANAVPIEELRDVLEFYQDMSEKTGPEEFEIAYRTAADKLGEVVESYE